MSIRLYVGNLPKEIERQELSALFAEFDESLTTKVITDRKTGKCRGFAFVTVRTDELADQFIEKYNGHLFHESPLKIEKAQPRAKGKGEDGADEGAEAPVVTGGGKKKSNNKSSSNKRPSTTSEPESVQPDPRWAQELEKLKQLLATQTANS